LSAELTNLMQYLSNKAHSVVEESQTILAWQLNPRSSELRYTI